MSDKYDEFEQLRDTDFDEYIKELKKPWDSMEQDLELAMEIIERFHSKNAAQDAMQDFIQRFQKGQLPDEIPEHELDPANSPWMIGAALKDAGLVSSTSEAIRMIKQGAVKINGEKVEDAKLELEFSSPLILQVGKRKVAKVNLAN